MVNGFDDEAVISAKKKNKNYFKFKFKFKTTNSSKTFSKITHHLNFWTTIQFLVIKLNQLLHRNHSQLTLVVVLFGTRNIEKQLENDRYSLKNLCI